MWNDSFICVTWPIYTCDMTHSYVYHDSFICVPWLIHMCAMTHSYVSHESFICVPWLIHMCAMTHSTSRPGDTTRSYGRNDSCIYVTWLIHVCDMTHPHKWGGRIFTRIPLILCSTSLHVPQLIPLIYSRNTLNTHFLDTLSPCSAARPSIPLILSFNPLITQSHQCLDTLSLTHTNWEWVGFHSDSLNILQCSTARPSIPLILSLNPLTTQSHYSLHTFLQSP